MLCYMYIHTYTLRRSKISAFEYICLCLLLFLTPPYLKKTTKKQHVDIRQYCLYCVIILHYKQTKWLVSSVSPTCHSVWLLKKGGWGLHLFAITCVTLALSGSSRSRATTARQLRTSILLGAAGWKIQTRAG